ncbi:MAG: leucine-rich repeat domain-containing protein [Muribaculaceae bacterium]|nr:leucine-rich repeat domain-containing protein [Muribaculaceae bacterium]
MNKNKLAVSLIFLQCIFLAGAKSFEYNGIKYNVISGTNEVEVSKTKIAGDINIPQTVKDKKESYTVTGIAAKAFEKNNQNYSIQLPPSVTEIGEKSFAGSSLSAIDMPGVEKIGDKAFADCPYLKTVVIPQTVNYIGTGAFDNTPLQNLIFSDADSEITIMPSSYPGKGMFSTGVENLYIGRNLKYSQFPFNGNVPTSLKRILWGNNTVIKWERPNPQIPPVYSEERHYPVPVFDSSKWNQLTDFTDTQQEIIYAKLLKEQEEREKAEKLAAEKAAKEKQEKDLTDLIDGIEKIGTGKYIKKTANGYSMTFHPYVRLYDHDGDYSNPLHGLLNQPTRNVTMSISPTTLTITDTEEIQITCPFNSRTGNPTRPEDPYKDAFLCPKTAETSVIPSLGGLESPFTYSCSHSMYKTKAGDFAPWRVKHSMTTTYNLATIAKKNKTTVKNVLQAWIDFAFKKEYFPVRVLKTGDEVNVMTVRLEGDTDELNERTLWLYMLGKMRDKVK